MRLDFTNCINQGGNTNCAERSSSMWRTTDTAYRLVYLCIICDWRRSCIPNAHRSVRLKLQRGDSTATLAAEHYDSATIYFSDVTDFADLSAMYNPMQVIIIMNEIYRCVNYLDYHLSREMIVQMRLAVCISILIDWLLYGTSAQKGYYCQEKLLNNMIKIRR